MICESNEKCNIIHNSCSTVPFNPNVIELKENNFSFDDCHNDNYNSFNSNNQNSSEKSGYSFKDTLNFFNIKSDGDRLNMFGFSLRIDTLIIIGIIIFLIFQRSIDVFLLICLGLILLDFKLDFLNLFG